MNPRFGELGEVLTKVALEPSRMVLCSLDWGAHGGNEYWPTLLDTLTLTSIQLPDDAIYVPQDAHRETWMGKHAKRGGWEPSSSALGKSGPCYGPGNST